MAREINLILVGGGDSHAIVLDLWARFPFPNVNLILVSDVTFTPYSGMLPGYVAGFYSYEETHINLEYLARRAGAQLYIERAIGLDLNHNLLHCGERGAIPFDYLSFDIGSTPSIDNIPSAEEYAIKAKPVPVFLEAWEKIKSLDKPAIITIVGGGAGGVELALNMGSRLPDVKINIIHRGERLLNQHNRWVSKSLTRICTERGITLYLKEQPLEVKASGVICESDLYLPSDYVIWVTAASPVAWIQSSALTTDERGFIAVTDTLRSVSHPHIFAAGDIATMIHHPRLKAGVFAVRQGQPLWENLTRVIRGEELKPHIPQKRYLSLIGTGDKKAIASWSFFGWRSGLLWQLKDRIDRAFMPRFEPNL
ncbi:MAG: hypothetical protein N5P05_000441 [Chroococcopsis gigantea SAG 12.99]|jgi:pyridine nucleotide-disulfide oxidoreductase family protein|nr:hypothetical protein [Chroococcopsis gigantea SAG 12.99]